jgi:ribulose-5-phosphate 4-epimerase/fuculose-1-phosphate aldolase
VDPGGTIGTHLPLDQVLGAVTFITAEPSAPGHSVARNPHLMMLGEPNNTSTPRLQELCELLTAAGIEARPIERLRDKLRTKLVANLTSNPLSVLEETTLDQIYSREDLPLNLHGSLVEPSPYPANPAGFALHSAIHGARHDAHCVVHTHTTPISAIALKRAGFGHDDFYGAQLTGRIGYHTFEGITLFDDEKQRMLESLGDKHVLVLRNHGVAVCEADIPRTFFLLWTVQRAAEIQCLPRSMAGDDVSLPEGIGQKCADLARDLIAGHDFAEKWFATMVRRMRSRR